MANQRGTSRAETPAFPVDAERVRGHGIIKRGAEQVGEADYELMITPPHLETNEIIGVSWFRKDA